MKKMIVSKINGDYRLVEASSVKSFRKIGIRYNEHGIATNRILIECSNIDVLIYANIKKFITKGHVIHTDEMSDIVHEAIMEHLDK